MAFVLPPVSQVGYLDPEIAGEGTRVLMSDGTVELAYTPPPVAPVMPDWSKIKTIRKYFGRTNHPTWPAWLYHPSEPARIVKNAQEAAELGICYREASFDEIGRYGVKMVWDWKDDCEWRAKPFEKDLKFDPKKPGQGKTYMASAPDPVNAQHELVKALIPEVAAAVAKAMVNAGSAAPAGTGIDPKQWEAFLQFQAWQKTAEAMDAMESEVAAPALAAEPAPSALSATLSEAEEYALWKAEAETFDIKVDGRWSLTRLKEEVAKRS